jgi:ketosteroid isomerase-like protein
MNATISRLCERMNAHDADGMAALFAPDYRSKQPAHPNRRFDGHEQVAANWSEMFNGVPDLTAEVVSEVTVGSTCWAEWVWHGHHTDGSPFEMRGTTIVELVHDGLIAEMRLYMEPVERNGPAIDDAVRRLADPSPPGRPRGDRTG